MKYINFVQNKNNTLKEINIMTNLENDLLSKFDVRDVKKEVILILHSIQFKIAVIILKIASVIYTSCF